MCMWTDFDPTRCYVFNKMNNQQKTWKSTRLVPNNTYQQITEPKTDSPARTYKRNKFIEDKEILVERTTAMKTKITYYIF